MIELYTHIVIHHSATKDSGTVSWQAIRKYHLRRGWRDTGYNFGVELVNDEYEILIGRELYTVGDHCGDKYMNMHGIGVCCIGNYSIEAPPEKMLDLLVQKLVEPLMITFQIPKDHIIFHRDIKPTECPGLKFHKDLIYDRIRT